MPNVLIKNVVDNTYRDRNMNPTTQEKIDSIKESIGQTGFWDNLLCRIQFNELQDGTIVEDHEHLTSLLLGGLDLSKETVELAYGHNRIDALRDMGYESMDVPIKFITDEDMMRIMANENKEGWGSSINTILETVKQVKGRLVDFFDDYSGYADYVKSVGKDKVVFSKKQFQEARANGVGYRTVQQFLGDSWNATDVRIPMAVFRAVDKGYFKQEDISGFPTLGILDSFTSCVAAIYEGGKIKVRIDVKKLDKEGKAVTDADGNPVMVKADKFDTVIAPMWPNAFKIKMVKALVKQCVPADVKDENEDDVVYVKEIIITQSEINKRRINMLKKQSAPTTGGASKFQLKKEIVREYFPGFDPATPDEERVNLHTQLTGKDMNNFIAEDGIGGWSGLDGMVAELVEDFGILLVSSEEITDDLQDKMDDEQGKTDEYESDYKDLEMELTETDDDGVDVELPIGQVGRNVVDLLNVSMIGIDGLIGRASEINLADDELLSDAIRISIAKLTKLYTEAATYDDASVLVYDIMETLKPEEVKTPDPKKTKKGKKAKK